MRHLLAVTITIACVGLIPLQAQQPATPQSTTASPATPSPSRPAPLPSGNSDDLIRQIDDASSSNNSEGPAGMVPYAPGFNASLISSSEHDSTSGWSNLLTPNVAWRFNRHFSMNAEVPVYTYLNVSIVTGQALVNNVETNTYKLQTKNFLFGDTTVAATFELHPRYLDYDFTATMGAPTGNFPYGLGAGQYTYNINNHFEHGFFGWLAPDIELGIGDSSSLLDSSIRKSFVAVGEQAHFQAGFSFALRWSGSEFTTDAYEDMPLSSQTVTTITNKGKKGTVKLVKSTSQEGIGEDNGFANSLDIPITGHISLTGFYNRSLRNHEDTAGFSLAYILRGTGKRSVH